MRIRALGPFGLAMLALTGAAVAWAQSGSGRQAHASHGHNPCHANPCHRNPCSANPCQHNPCAANPCAQNPCAGPNAPGDVSEDAPISSIDQLIDEFMATSVATAGRPGGQEAVQFPGPEGRPDWFRLLAVTRAENPLLEEECKKQAVQLSVDHLAEVRGIAEEKAALRAAAQHIRMHQDFVTSHGISYSAYLREISECKAFCAPVVARLLECQVLSVARRPHGIVLFELDSDAVDARYEQGALANLAAQLDADPERRVALIGRASRIGELDYNRRLSAQRALAARDRLIALDVAPERVETMWFGWEPPQISAWIADEYGMRELYESEGELRMNQSVVGVVY
jgi:outer membrane protein OmpA-like peptidoglycan-associated protein